jgi:hypothetical protein
VLWLPVDVDALRVIRNLQTRPDVTIRSIRTSTESLEEAEHLLIGYVQYLLDMRIRSVGFLDLVRHMQSIPAESTYPPHHSSQG